MLQDMAFITVGCCRLLAEMHNSVARDMLFRYMTLPLLLNILFVSMFGVLSPLMSFLLCIVYLRCFMLYMRGYSALSLFYA